MNAEEHRKLSQLRRDLRGTGLFCFEKNGTFLLYREVVGGPNTKVLTSKSIDDFVRNTNKVITK
jgi:hypothetical protein